MQPFEHANLQDAFPLEREQAIKEQTKKRFPVAKHLNPLVSYTLKKKVLKHFIKYLSQRNFTQGP